VQHITINPKPKATATPKPSRNVQPTRAEKQLLSKPAAGDNVGSMLRGGKGTGKQLVLDSPSGTNPWLDDSEIVSTIAPKDFKIYMAMAENQIKPGGWGTLDEIGDVNYVRNKLAVTPEFKPEVSKVQQFLVPEGTRIQIGTVGPQMHNGIMYPGGGNQVQILNYFDRDKLIPIGDPYKIK
jgi:hypothetical protein